MVMRTWYATLSTCKLAGATNYPTFKLNKPTEDATTKVRTATTAAASFADATPAVTSCRKSSQV